LTGSPLLAKSSHIHELVGGAQEYREMNLFKVGIPCRPMAFVILLSLVGMSPAYADVPPSPEGEALRRQLTPSQPQNLPEPSEDLSPLNPNPNPLNLPTAPTEVTIDLSKPITLQQALILAQRNNRDLQVTALDVQRAQASLDEARADRLPQVAVEGSINRSQTIADSEDVLPPGSNTAQATAQANFDVFTAGQRPASIQAARESLLASELDYKTQLWTLQLDVTNDYYDLQQADGLVQIAAAARDNARDSLRDTVALEQAGLGTRFDVLRAQVQLADREQQLTQAKSQQEVSRRQLAQRLSLADQATLTTADPVQEVGQWPLSLEESITTAQSYRAELAAVVSEREISLLNRKIVKGSLGPLFSVSGSVSATGNLQDSVSDSIFGTPSNPTGDIGYSVGGTLSKTLFDGGATKAQIRQQEVNTQIADTQFANTKNVIRFQVEQNYFSALSSLQNIDTNRKAVEQAKESLRLARLRFKEGVGTQLEVSNEETALTRAESNLLQAVIDYNRALVGLQRFVANPSLVLQPLPNAKPIEFTSTQEESNLQEPTLP
jgi:OMF family outer membrane factor